MSKITSIYNSLVTKLDTMFPASSGYHRLPNGYKIESNPDHMLEKGYGIAFRPGEDTNSEICKVSFGRTIVITLTRKVFSLENSAATRGAGDLSLLEDQFLLIKTLKPETFSDNASDFVMTTDGGIDYVRSGDDSILMIQSSFDLKYFENY